MLRQVLLSPHSRFWHCQKLYRKFLHTRRPEDNQEQIIKYFKKLVIMAYGVKSLDGRQFVKNDKIREEFASTVAYSDIFMELAHDATIPDRVS